MTAAEQAVAATVPRDPPGSRAERVSEIDSAKGIGIVLVVFGHMVARDVKPLGNDWWLAWHDHLYSFHMAFFFFLSGYVFFLQPANEWAARLRKSAVRLGSAYLLFAAIVFVAKIAAVRVLHVDRPVQEPLTELVRMMRYPTEGFAQFLWFIYTLLMIYGLMVLIAPWVQRYYKTALTVAFAGHVLSVTGHVTELFALHQLARYTLFFLVAAACHRYAPTWQRMVLRYGMGMFALFVAALVTMPEEWLPTIAGLLSIPALVGLAAWGNRRSEALLRVMQFLGRNTLTIYLMNSLAMGFVRALVLRTWGWDGWHFFVVAPLLLAAGLALPIIAQRLLFSRWQWTDRITR